MYLLSLEAKEKAGTISQSELSTLEAGRDRLATARATNTDWIDVMTHDGFSMDHTLSLTGCNDKTKVSHQSPPYSSAELFCLSLRDII